MKQLTAILLLLSITGIYSTFKLDVNVGVIVDHLASDKPTSKDTMSTMKLAVKAGTDCATSYAADDDIASDFLYKKCLDDNCVTADDDWSTNTKDFDQVPLTILACVKTCSPLATAGNALKHMTCLKAGLTGAGVASTKLMMDYVVLAPVSLYYANSIEETTPYKFNTYGRYMRDVAKHCSTHGHVTDGLWESNVPTTGAGRIFRLVHAAKVKKMDDASICSTEIDTSATYSTEFDLKKASDCLLEAAKIAFPNDDNWLTCAADAALPITAGRLNLAKVYAPDGEQTFDQKDKGGKLDAIYTSFASCIGALAGTAFNYAEVYQGYVNGGHGNNYFGLAAPAGVNQQVTIDKMGINILHEKGYKVKHCYVSNTQCVDFIEIFQEKERKVKNYERNVIKNLDQCWDNCLGIYDLGTESASSVNSHSDLYQLIAVDDMTLQSHFKAEVSKYEKCHMDFKDSWYKTQRMIREE